MLAKPIKIPMLCVNIRCGNSLCKSCQKNMPELFSINKMLGMKRNETKYSKATMDKAILAFSRRSVNSKEFADIFKKRNENIHNEK